MAESSRSATPPARKYSTPKTVGHIKMLVIGDFKASTITGKIKTGTDGNADVTTDGFSSYAALEKDGVTTSHHAVVADDKKSVGKVLPWVHISCNSTLTSSVISSTEGIWASDSLTGSNFAHVRIGRTLNIEFIDWQLADIH